jgi:hypothetical protein
LVKQARNTVFEGKMELLLISREEAMKSGKNRKSTNFRL